MNDKEFEALIQQAAQEMGQPLVAPESTEVERARQIVEPYGSAATDAGFKIGIPEAISRNQQNIKEAAYMIAPMAAGAVVPQLSAVRALGPVGQALAEGAATFGAAAGARTMGNPERGMENYSDAALDAVGALVPMAMPIRGAAGEFEQRALAALKNQVLTPTYGMRNPNTFGARVEGAMLGNLPAPLLRGAVAEGEQQLAQAASQFTRAKTPYQFGAEVQRNFEGARDAIQTQWAGAIADIKPRRLRGEKKLPYQTSRSQMPLKPVEQQGVDQYELQAANMLDRSVDDLLESNLGISWTDVKRGYPQNTQAERVVRHFQFTKQRVKDVIDGKVEDGFAELEKLRKETGALLELNPSSKDIIENHRDAIMGLYGKILDAESVFFKGQDFQSLQRARAGFSEFANQDKQLRFLIRDGADAGAVLKNLAKSPERVEALQYFLGDTAIDDMVDTWIENAAFKPLDKADGWKLKTWQQFKKQRGEIEGIEGVLTPEQTQKLDFIEGLVAADEYWKRARDAQMSPGSGLARGAMMPALATGAYEAYQRGGVLGVIGAYGGGLATLEALSAAARAIQDPVKRKAILSAAGIVSARIVDAVTPFETNYPSGVETTLQPVTGIGE